MYVCMYIRMYIHKYVVASRERDHFPQQLSRELSLQIGKGKDALQNRKKINQVRVFGLLLRVLGCC
jgi:hypothetical protein